MRIQQAMAISWLVRHPKPYACMLSGTLLTCDLFSHGVDAALCLKRSIGICESLQAPWSWFVCQFSCPFHSKESHAPGGAISALHHSFDIVLTHVVTALGAPVGESI